MDCREDARSFAMLDYDSDGWLDIALMSTGAPRFRLFRNRIGELKPEREGALIRLEGGNHTPQAGRLSNRDAAGAEVLVITSAGKRLFRRSAG